MKKLLVLILVLQISGALLTFFSQIGTQPALAVINGLLALLPAVITVAVLVCLDRTELLSGEISELRYMLKKLGDRENPRGDYSSNPSAEYKETALGTWECVKCGTVNKEGTSFCSNCKAEYSPWVNPTKSPYEKKKVSRWIKEDKKKK